MRKRIIQIYNNASLATKIRYSYFVIIIPMVIFPILCFYNLWRVNQNYENMVQSVGTASEFSLDFKKDFDYETYLLVVENKTIEESDLDSMLNEAERIVNGLEVLTTSEENRSRLESTKKYLKNLRTYKERIELNLREGNKYEDNIEIWENDIQVVTSLIRESIVQYMYLEINDLKQVKEENQQILSSTMRLLAMVFVIILAVIIILSYLIPKSITSPIRRLGAVTDEIAKGNLSVRAEPESGMEVERLSRSMNSMIDKINELLEQVTKEQVRLRKAEFELLQSQINPHFLYNTLDAIVWLAEAGEQKKVVRMVGSLSEFFRTSLNQGKELNTLREEEQHIRSYLEIQQVRYQDILSYDIRIPEEIYRCTVPKITIQPLVENALYHGIKNKRGPGKILISGERDGEKVILRVEDNGIGIKEERLKQIRDGIYNKIPTEKNIYGLYNVNERIRLNFGEAYGISLDSTYGKGSVVCIVIPYTE